MLPRRAGCCGEEVSLLLKAGGKQREVPKMYRGGVLLDSSLLSSLVLTLCLGELTTALSNLLAQKPRSHICP